MVDDFLECVPLASLPLCVACVAAFGRQHTDMNVSLTAVGMLWTVVDFVSHRRGDGGDDCDGSSGGSGGGGGKGVSGPVWDAMLEELGRLGVDGRPEVRNWGKPTEILHASAACLTSL